MKHIEIEYKMLLGIDQYQDILTSIQDKAECIKQSNMYLDSKIAPLYLNKQSLRCRVINDQFYELTLKQKREKDNLELNFDLNKDEFDLLKTNPYMIVSKYINDMPSDIEIIGQLDNIRYEWEDNGIYALDKSSYFNKIDYEIEYEALNYEQKENYEQKDNLVRFLKKYNIEFKENHTTKIQRFIEELKKQGDAND